MNAARLSPYLTQQPAANISSSYFPFSSTSPTLPTASTGAMTTQYDTMAGYQIKNTSNSGTTMYSRPTMVFATTTMNSVYEPQGIIPSAVSVPVATTPSIWDVNIIDLLSSLTTTAGKLDTSHNEKDQVYTKRSVECMVCCGCFDVVCTCPVIMGIFAAPPGERLGGENFSAMKDEMTPIK